MRNYTFNTYKSNSMKNIINLSLLQLLSQASFQLFTLTCLFWMTSHASAAYMAAFMAFDSVPALILYSYAGHICDIKSPALVLKRCTEAISVVLIGLGIYVYINTPDAVYPIILVICAGLLSIIKGFFQPAILSIIPKMVSVELFKSSNAAVSAAEQLGRCFGFLFAGFLISEISLELVILICGSLLIVTRFFNIKEIKSSIKATPKEFRFKFCLEYLNKNPSFKTFFIFVVISNFLFSPFIVFFPLFSQGMHLSKVQSSVLLTCFAGGQLIFFLASFIFKISLPFKNSIKYAHYLLGLCLIAVGSAHLLMTNYLFYSLALFLFLMGVSFSVININLVTLLQIKIDKEVQGQIFGFLKTIAGSAIPVGMILSSLVLAGPGQSSTTVCAIYSVCGILILLAIFLFNKIRSFNQFYTLSTK